MESKGVSVDDFRCAVCFEILVDPTSLACGHTVCRYCLAQWWEKANKTNCPECRQEWKGFPKVNVTLRNTINKLYPDQVEAQTAALNQNPDYMRAVGRFERMGASYDPPDHAGRRERRGCTHLLLICAVMVAVAVIISVGMRNITGTSKSDLMMKPINDWSVEEVGFWIGELAPWAKKHFQNKFLEEGVDGSLLVELTERDLLKLGMILPSQQEITLGAIHEAKQRTKHKQTGLWEYKERRSGMALFIMFGLRDFPRSTLLYLYLFNYRDSFLPLFHCSIRAQHTNSSVCINMQHTPSANDWKEFIPRLLVAPYYLVARFASVYLDVNYWTSRVIILHSVLMTIIQLTKLRTFSRNDVRNIPTVVVKSFVYVALMSLLIKVACHFLPMTITDCVFYWMLYVSPLDALNKLWRRLTRNSQQNPPLRTAWTNPFRSSADTTNNPQPGGEMGGETSYTPHQTPRQGVNNTPSNSGGRLERSDNGWSFNVRWSSQSD